MADAPLIVDMRAAHCQASRAGKRPGSAHASRVPAERIVAVRCGARRHLFYCSLCADCYAKMSPDWSDDSRHRCPICTVEGIDTRGGLLLETIEIKAAG